MTHAVSGLNHITLSVTDLDRSFEFYSRVLGFEPVARWNDGAYLEAGDLWLALVRDGSVGKAKRPDYSHIALTCGQESYGQIVKALEAEGCPTWSENRTEGASYYFLDPDGHKLEIHIGNLESRLKDMKENPWTDIQFFR